MLNHDAELASSGERTDGIHRYKMGGWLAYFSKKEEFELAMKKLILLAIERPEDALQIIHHVARTGASDDTLDQMTAGPLQTTLDRHGDAVRGLVESYSASSPVFKEMVRDAHP